MGYTHMSGFSFGSSGGIGGQGGGFNGDRRFSGLPSMGSIGGSIGAIGGGMIKQGLLKLGPKAFPGLFNNKYLGPLANQIWGNLFYSSGDLLAVMERRADPLMNIDWTIGMPFEPEMAEYVEQINFSATAFDSAPYVRAGRTINLASVRNTAPINVIFYGDVNNLAINYIDDWKRRVGNPDGTFNYPTEYRGTISVNIVDQTGQYMGTYLLANCWPVGAYQIDLSSSDVERVRITQDFSCDQVVFVPYGTPKIGPVTRA